MVQRLAAAVLLVVAVLQVTVPVVRRARRMLAKRNAAVESTVVPDVSTRFIRSSQSVRRAEIS